MNTSIVQQLRYKLQKRVRKVNSSGFQTFHFSLKRFWQFLHSNEVFVGVLEQASKLVAAGKDDAARILKGEALQGCNEDEEVCLAYWVIRSCVESDVNKNMEIHIAHIYSHATKHDESLEMFKDIFIEPLYEYIDEQLDDQRAVLGLLRRYKHHCEWFRRNDLLNIFADEKARSSESGKKSRGEKQLALHLYEFLHSQGLAFSIEPASISGEADLVSAQNSDDPLIADIKVFDPQSGKNKSYLISGFHQVYQYTLDYNESFGYLVIFKTCEEGLAFSSGQQEQSISFVTFNGKTIFFIVIDLFAHEKSASKRGKLKSYVITEQELVTKQIDTEMPQAAPTSEDIEQAAGDGGQQ
jgi:hypothetical protein